MGEESLLSFIDCNQIKYFINEIPIAFQSLNPDGIINYVNKKWCLELGYTEKEVIGKCFENYLIEEDKKIFIDEFKNVRKINDIILHLITKDGKIIITSFDGLCIFNKQNILIKSLCIFQNITNKKNVEYALSISNDKYKRLFDTSPNLICETDDKGNFLSVNPAIAKSIGIPSEKLIGKNIYDIFPKNVADKRGNIAKKALKTGNIHEFEDNREGRFFHNIFVPIFHNNGKKSIQLIAKDITSEKITQEALEESEEKYRTVVENIGEGITIFQDDKLIYANNKMTEISGYSIDQLCSFNLKDIIKIIHPEDRKFMLNNIKNRMSKKDMPNTYHFRIITPKGDLKYLEIISNLIDFKGKNTVISVYTDVTNRKLKEFEMKKKLMRFNIEENKVYFIPDNEKIKKITIINDLHKVGYNRYIISRNTEEQIKHWLKGAFNYRRLAEINTKNSIKPNIFSIKKYLSNIPKNSVIVIDRLEYLISRINFKKVLKLIQYINELAYLNNHIILISVDLSSLTTIELNLIINETEIIESHSKIKLPEDMLEILKLIYSYNLRDEKPSYVDIMKSLNISKPTISVKMKELSKYGYIKIYPSGRSKKSEITEKTRNLFEK